MTNSQDAAFSNDFLDELAAGARESLADRPSAPMAIGFNAVFAAISLSFNALLAIGFVAVAVWR